MRRTSHPATGVACALVALLGVVSASPSAAMAQATTTWRADGYGPANTGYNPVETAINADTVGTLDASPGPSCRRSSATHAPGSRRRWWRTTASSSPTRAGSPRITRPPGHGCGATGFPRPLDDGDARG